MFVCLFLILQTVCLVGIAVLTFFFTLVWQFAQFILLLESMAFFGTYSLGVIPKYKVRSETGKGKLPEVTQSVCKDSQEKLDIHPIEAFLDTLLVDLLQSFLDQSDSACRVLSWLPLLLILITCDFCGASKRSLTIDFYLTGHIFDLFHAVFTWLCCLLSVVLGSQSVLDCDWLSDWSMHPAVCQWHDPLFSCTELCCCFCCSHDFTCEFFFFILFSI